MCAPHAVAPSLRKRSRPRAPPVADSASRGLAQRSKPAATKGATARFWAPQEGGTPPTPLLFTCKHAHNAFAALPTLRSNFGFQKWSNPNSTFLCCNPRVQVLFNGYPFLMKQDANRFILCSSTMSKIFSISPSFYIGASYARSDFSFLKKPPADCPAIWQKGALGSPSRLQAPLNGELSPSAFCRFKAFLKHWLRFGLAMVGRLQVLCFPKTFMRL